MNNPEHYMTRCLELSEVALKKGNPPVGALLASGNKIIGEGIESGKSTGDITYQAEIEAIREAIHCGHSDKLGSAVLYTTHEPCIMCSYVIRHHQIPQIVYGVSVDQIGGFTSEFPVLSTSKVLKWGDPPKIVSGVCEAQCRALTNRFINQIKRSS